MTIRSFHPLPARRSGRAGTIGIVALVVVALSACRKKEDAPAGEEKTPSVVGARTAVAVGRPFVETIGAIGTVVARAGHVASLSAPAATRVSEVLTAVGGHVTRGQALVRLEQTMFQAAAQSAEARLTASERAFERAQRLSAEGIIPRKDVEQAQADLAVARAEVVTARRSSELSVLRSPIAGVVTRLSAVLGASVDANQSLVEIADPSALDILLNVTPTEAGRIHLGAAVALTAGQSASGERLGVGNIADVAGTVDTLTRSVAVRVRSTGVRRALRIGETVFGQIAVATRANAITVPSEALVPDGEGFKVFVVDDKGIAHARPVSIGARADSVVEITKGLAIGERVVTYGAYGVDDSSKVVPVNAVPGTEPDEKGAKGDEKDAATGDEKDAEKKDAEKKDAEKKDAEKKDAGKKDAPAAAPAKAAVPGAKK